MNACGTHVKTGTASLPPEPGVALRLECPMREEESIPLQRKGGDDSPPFCFRYPKICEPGVPTSPRFDRGRRGTPPGAGRLERQTQAERHDARARSNEKLCLAK